MENLQKLYSQIYDKYVDKIYRFIFLKVNSQEVAEDLSSETFLRGWQAFYERQGNNSKNHKKIENPPAFLYQIARNLVVDFYREKGKCQVVSVENNPIADPGINLEEKSLIDSEFQEIKGALSNLKDDYQTVIIWYYLDDLPVPEIARALKKSEQATRVMLHRALKALKTTINNEQRAIEQS